MTRPMTAALRANLQNLTHTTEEGLFLLEVFPALALAGFNPKYCERLAAPKYNPERRKTYRHADWLSVINTLEKVARTLSVFGASPWFSTQLGLSKPAKSHQDMLDAVICAFIGLHWLTPERSQSMMLGDLRTGYIVAPVLRGIHPRIINAAARLGVSVDGRIPES
jgi:predicted RNase H-like nuclease